MAVEPAIEVSVRPARQLLRVRALIDQQDAELVRRANQMTDLADENARLRRELDTAYREIGRLSVEQALP